MFFFIALIATFIASFVFSYYLIPLCMKIAYKLNILDYPNGVLKQQKSPVAYLGGLAVYGGFILSLALFFPFANNDFLLLVGSTILLFLGLMDDIIALSPLQKFVGQIVAAICFLKAGFYLKYNFFESQTHLVVGLMKFFSFVWILTIINAFNLIDIMDGLATTVALIATTGFLIIALIFHLPTVPFLLCALQGAMLAFLLINRPPAAMYLGDAGSLFLGGILAVIPFMFPWGTYNILGFCSPVIILAIPLLEVSSLIIIRTIKGIPFYQGSPDHFVHMLKRKKWRVVSILTIIALMGIFLNVIAFLNALGYLSFYQLLLCGTNFLLFWTFLVWE
ncbi:MAG: undecaprenyl/decaprenyl-phosphate alpha-N-acetylglucosaminyl 1-phosphate transferase [Candidatus Dependentiae bacterium]|nr:undecaprenyl/decaprenyl-phosphate alpha-N-acetylglucosaminyl 1-phosphate transferase [Candidatus Dependentiae bacterium]